MSEKIRTNCRACGHGGCGVLVRVQDGKITGIEGDKTHPISKGYICLKALASIEEVYHPQRLKHPLRRIGGKASGKWEPISWDEALANIAEKLGSIAKESGPEAVVFSHGTGRDYFHFMNRFSNLFGSPNYLTNGHVCWIPRSSVSKVLGLGGLPILDYDSSPDCVLVWGNNCIISNPDEYVGINLEIALKKGAKLIVVDVRRTPLSLRADIWLKPRPSTDLILSLGMIKYIIDEELYDKEFVENYAACFKDLQSHVRRYTPELVEALTSVPKDLVRETATMYATTKPAGIQWGVGIEQNVNCIATDTSLMYLVALTGNLDAPGGNVVFSSPPTVKYRDFGLPEKLSQAQADKRIGSQKYKMLALVNRSPPYAIWDSIIKGDPYQVRALFVAGSNLLVARENSHRVQAALEAVEFLVVSDIFMTPTAEYADIVLPAATWLEYNTVADYWKFHGYVFPRRKIVETPECWSDLKIFNELGKRLGFKEYFWDHQDDALDYIFEPAGISWSEFSNMPYLQGKVEYRKYRRDGFATKSGKFEFYPESFKDWGLGPLPEFEENPESPIRSPHLLKKYPYVLITGSRSIEYFNSEGKNIPSLREHHPDPIVEIHPATAKKHGIIDGDWVKIYNLRGEASLKAKLTESVEPQVIHAEHGWWYPEIESPDHGFNISNINVLTDDRPPIDPLMGSTCLRGLLCNIERK